MRSVACLLVLGALGACSQPLLANAPRPNPSTVAGVAAGAAAAATLAAPDYAAKKQEARKPDKSNKPQQVNETVPAGVLDRLDASPAAPGEPTEPAAQAEPAEPAAPAEPGAPTASDVPGAQVRPLPLQRKP